MTRPALPYVTLARVAAQLEQGPATARQIAEAVVRSTAGIASTPDDVKRTKRMLGFLQGQARASRSPGGTWTSLGMSEHEQGQRVLAEVLEGLGYNVSVRESMERPAHAAWGRPVRLGSGGWASFGRRIWDNDHLGRGIVYGPGTAMSTVERRSEKWCHSVEEAVDWVRTNVRPPGMHQ